MEYTVTWKIELSASSPKDAARLTLEIQRDPASSATVFDVQTGVLTDTKQRPRKWKNIDATTTTEKQDAKFLRKHQ